MKKNIDIFAHTKKVLFATYGRLVALLLLNVAVIFVIFVPWIVLWGSAGFSQGLLGVGLIDSPGTMWMVFFGISASIFGMFIAFITSAAVASVLIRNTSLLESITFGVTKGLRSIPVQLLLLVLLFVSSIPSFFLMLFASGITDSVLAVTLFLLGVFLLLLPLLIGLRSVFIVFVWLENQKTKAWSVIKKSFAITRGAVIWMLLLALVVVGVGAAIVHPLLVLLLSVLTTLPSEGILSSVVDQLISIFLFMPVVYALLYTLYVYAKKQSAGVKKRSV